MKIGKEIVKVLKKEQDFLLIGHINPDGDTIGALLALAIVLKKFKKTVTVLIDDTIPEIFLFLPEISLFTRQELRSSYQVIVTIDVANTGRLGKGVRFLKTAKTIINIDHHEDNTLFGHLNYIDPQSSAVGEQVFQLIKMLTPQIDQDTATCLYTSILSDTGGLQFPNTTADTLQIAYQLVSYGANHSRIIQQIFRNRTLSEIKLIGMVCENLQINSENRFCWAVVTQKMMEKVDACYEHTDRLVDFVGQVKDTDFAIMFKELNNGLIKVSLRGKDTNNQIQLNKIAALFNGGGHPKAAGFVAKGTIEEVKKLLFDAIHNSLYSLGRL